MNMSESNLVIIDKQLSLLILNSLMKLKLMGIILTETNIKYKIIEILSNDDSIGHKYNSTLLKISNNYLFKLYKEAKILVSKYKFNNENDIQLTQSYDMNNVDYKHNTINDSNLQINNYDKFKIICKYINKVIDNNELSKILM